MQRAKNVSAFGQLENGSHRMTKHMSLRLPSTAGGSVSSNPDGSVSGAAGGGGLKHHNTVTGANFTAIKRGRNKVGQISNSTRERWRQTTRNIKVRTSDWRHSINLKTAIIVNRNFVQQSMMAMMMMLI